ncbi:hypothetical protein EJ08DRAFT_654595 [Tothia fuscella]|uniref:Uncharacterized protein n=1 Tax=Tothia fuscella TaxID=1048955 RepID=A0A9P4TRK6_9PEZI|nr:hypothetical protein EJ08DRAFT_654595 [Tothia fuscella]
MSVSLFILCWMQPIAGIHAKAYFLYETRSLCCMSSSVQESSDIVAYTGLLYPRCLSFVERETKERLKVQNYAQQLAIIHIHTFKTITERLFISMSSGLPEYRLANGKWLCDLVLYQPRS